MSSHLSGSDGISISSASFWGAQSAKSSRYVKPVEKELRPVEMAIEMENHINSLLDEIATLRQKEDTVESLNKAKDAIKNEEALKKYKKEHALASEGQVELSFTVWFSVALSYEANDMPDEAKKAYIVLTKLRDHPLAGKARINLGNIHYAEHDYLSAIKMYKMALDLVLSHDKETVAKIRCNIGVALFHHGQIRDAIKNFEESMNASPNHRAGFNLLVCHLALGNVDGISRDFVALIKIGPTSDNIDNATNATLNENTNHILFSAARLVAPSMTLTELLDALKDDHEHLASRIEYDHAISLLKQQDIKHAVKKLRALEKKSPAMKATVATNLSFLHFLEGDIDVATGYADIAIDADRYSAKALVNKGNCFFANGDYASAKDLYLEAIGVESDCTQAIFNLGLSNVRLDLPNEAIETFEKLHSITPNNPVVIYHIADIHENQGNIEDAIRWFNVLVASQNSDSMILARLADLYSKLKDSSQSLHSNLESFRHFPVDLDVIARIGTFFVQEEMFEKALYFFKQAALVQPKEIKWSKNIGLDHFRLGLKLLSVLFTPSVDHY